MTDLTTAEEASRTIECEGQGCGSTMAVRFARTVIAQAAELAQARADAKAAVAVVVEKAADVCKAAAERYELQAQRKDMSRSDVFNQDIMQRAAKLCEASIRAIAPEDAIAEVAMLREQIKDLKFALGTCMDMAEARIASLAAELSAANAREAGLQAKVEAYEYELREMGALE